MRSVLTLPDARLRQCTRPVEHFDAALQSLLQELEAVMHAGPGGVGIAATQIGEMQSVVIVDCSRARHRCRHHGLLQMINPEIIARRGGETLGREGCLSVPDWVAMVPRFKRIRVRYHDVEGSSHTLSSEGFEARVIQHEVDHLQGILFIDHIISTHDLVRRMSLPD